MSAALQPPFNRLSFRWSAPLGRFLPCTDTDPRGSMVETVDSLGRIVIPLFGGRPFAGAGPRLAGYRLGHPSTLYDPADGLKWLTAEKSRRRKK
jgi:hypothetical protein